MSPRNSDGTTFVFSPSLEDSALPLNDEEMALVEKMEQPVEKDVDVTLTGTFRHGMITVEQRTIPLNASGTGSATVQVFPPSVSVTVLTSAPGPCRFEFSVKINGKEKSQKGVSPAGKQEHPFTYLFSEFGL